MAIWQFDLAFLPHMEPRCQRVVQMDMTRPNSCLERSRRLKRG